MATSPQWQVPEPEDITRRRLLEVNAIITNNHAKAIEKLYNPATKLAPTDEVNELTELLCHADIDLMGKVNAILQRRLFKLSGIITPQKIIKNHRGHIREWLREERLEPQLSLIDEETLWVMMYDGLIHKHGWRSLNVPGRDLYKAKSKWPYVRFLADARPSDLRANLRTQAAVVSQSRDALKEFELILTIARRLNPDGYARDEEMRTLLKPPFREDEESS